MDVQVRFESRRSPVYCRSGCVACSQPLAAEIGVEVLKNGGNAADAAVAVAAALNVTEPCSTGIGGDCFCLFYDARSKTVQGINGSGRAPVNLTLDLLESRGYSSSDPLPTNHALTVTVPGAAAGWVDTVERFGTGKLSMKEILQPAINLAEEGFPVSSITAHAWSKGASLLQASGNTHGRDMLMGRRAPLAGEVMRMPLLANTFKVLAEHGKVGFYEGKVADSLVKCVQDHGGVMTSEDLQNHQSTFDCPIKTCYRGIDVWEMPPNGQGITALLALNILEGFDFTDIKHNSAQYLHLLIEAMCLSFADSRWYCADPSKVSVPVEHLLCKEYASRRRQLIQPSRCLAAYEKGSPCSSSDTVYFSVTDRWGNACSFINSNYMGFGTGLVPEGCGFTLQNRGYSFSLNQSHPNAVAPGKRPYHTIIPGMATHSLSRELYTCFGVMGGFMQPQGHVQVLLNMIEYGMDAQTALDSSRFCIDPGHSGCTGEVALEEGISMETASKLRDLGHQIRWPVQGYDRSLFGRGQIIRSQTVNSRGENGNIDLRQERIWLAGSDSRADGAAVGY